MLPEINLIKKQIQKHFSYHRKHEDSKSFNMENHENGIIS